MTPANPASDFNAHFQRGRAQEQRGQLDLAIESYRQAIALKPDLVAGHLNLGVVLYKAGQKEAGVAALAQAIALDPKLALAHSNRGMILAELNRLDEAEASTRRACELAPNNASFACNHAIVLGWRRRFDESLAEAQRAIAIDPSDHGAHAVAGLALLYLGRMREGFREFEWRQREWSGHATGRKTWDGSPLNGRTVVLRAEQGFGDTIHFIRYAPLVAEQRGGRVLVECPAVLKDLIKTVRGVDAVYAPGEAAPDAELEIWMMSLAERFETTLQTIPAQVPYIHHDPQRVGRFATLLGHAPGLKVGLNWAGNPDFMLDATRSTQLATFAPLLDVPGVTWVSFQKGPGHARDAADIKKLGLIDVGSHCHDFADSAAAMSLLDLIITTDTAVPHLAGALGRPVWTLLEFHPEWRWMQDRSDSPWYPTMRLFRQPAPGDWAGLVRQVVAALQDRLNSPTT